MNIVAIVLAAGAGRRMGRPKALLPWRGGTLLSHACDLLDRPGVAARVAVIGAEAAEVREQARLGDGVVVIENEAWRSGMLSSVLRGLDAAEEVGAEAILLHPVDHPLVDPTTVDRVAAALAGGALLAVPRHAGRRGHPGGFGREAFAALRAVDPSEGARAVLARFADRVVHVEGDPGCRAGINTPEDYRRAQP